MSKWLGQYRPSAELRPLVFVAFSALVAEFEADLLSQRSPLFHIASNFRLVDP